MGLLGTLAGGPAPCGLCGDVLEDPVVASCGHSFCRQCITAEVLPPKPYMPYSPIFNSFECYPFEILKNQRITAEVLTSKRMYPMCHC